MKRSSHVSIKKATFPTGKPLFILTVICAAPQVSATKLV
jgi:hypothetical protein